MYVCVHSVSGALKARVLYDKYCTLILWPFTLNNASG